MSKQVFTTKKEKRSLHIKKIALIGMLAASITGAKFALAALPNIEIVTLLIIIYSAVFGITTSMPVVIIFVSAEMLIYGVNTWVISYYVYWSLLALASALVKLVFGEKYLPYVIMAPIMTTLFGVITTFVDALFMVGTASRGFFECFGIIYLRGITFYVIHIVSNTIIVALLFVPLRNVLNKLKSIYFQENRKNIAKNDD